MARVTQEIFLSRCRATHGDTYDLSRVVYTGRKNKIEVVCATHGSFFPHAGNFSDRGSECPLCVRQRTGEGQRKDAEAYLSQFAEIHGDKFTYNGIFYTQLHPYVRVVCPLHGEFTQRAYAHAKGAGCPKCSAPVRDTESFILAAREVHGDKYDYSRSHYVMATKPVEIVCPIHGVFKQWPNAHVNCRQGCRKCAKTGFNPREPAVVYVYLLSGSSGEYVGFGITNDFTARDRKHRRTTAKAGFTLNLVQTFKFASGDDAWAAEKLIKSSVEIVNLGIEGFKTEAANESSLPEILRILYAA